MTKPEIDVCFNSVFVAKQHVKRPDSMSASDWVEFWDGVKLTDPCEITALKQKLEDAIMEIRELENLVEDLREEIRELEDE